jgi:hypothetical protein
VNDYRVSFTFRAPDDIQARKRIHEGTVGLASMRIVNLGERQTVRVAAWAVFLTLVWSAVAWYAWPYLVALWSRS